VAGIWECPDLFELPVLQGSTPTGRKRWVLVVNINGGTPAGGSGTQYFVGDFDGKTFTNDNPKETVLWADWGADFYAAQSFSDVPANDGRRIWLAWMSNWRYANQEPTKPWRTAMTMPRELRLLETGRGMRLRQVATKESEILRMKSAEGGFLIPQILQDVVINEGDDPLKGRLKGDALELQIEFTNVEADEVGLKVRVGDGQETVIGFDARKKEVFVDRTKSGLNFHKEFAARHAAKVVAPNNSMLLHVWVDRSSVELLAEGGLVSITERIYPDARSQGVSVYATGGKARVKHLFAWKLKSVWE
jgi:fructan beta-fructosidase